MVIEMELILSSIHFEATLKTPNPRAPSPREPSHKESSPRAPNHKDSSHRVTTLKQLSLS